MLLASANNIKQKGLEIETEVEKIVGKDTDKHLKQEGNEFEKKVKKDVIATEERDNTDINPETTTSKPHVNKDVNKDSKNTKSQTANSDSNKNTDSGGNNGGNNSDNKGGNEFFQLLFNFASVASAIASVIAIYMAKQALEYETKKDIEKAIEDIESDLSKLVVKVGAFNREDMCKLGQILDRINGNEDVKAYFSLQEKISGAFVHIDTISNLLYCTNKWASQYMLNHNGRGIDHVRNKIKNIDEIFFGFLHNSKDLSFKIETKFNGLSQNEKYIYILEKLNQEKPFELRSLHEVFVNLVYLTGRTYIYESKYDEALQFFQILDEKYGQNGCFEYVLAKRNGIGIINDQRIEEMLKSSTRRPEELDKIKQNIKLFNDLKNDDHFYRVDYSTGHDESYIRPSKDQRHVLECNKKLIKYYSLLIKLKEKDDHSGEKRELIKILHTIKDDNVFVDSNNKASNDKISANFKNSLLNSLGFALIVLPDSNDKTIERMIAEIVGFNKKGWCSVLCLDTYPEKNELIRKIFNKVLDQSESDYKKYARADAHDGLYVLETLKLDKKPLEVCPDKIARDEINELLNRTTEYGDVIIAIENYDDVQAIGEL